jgi:hypothetical protein
MRRANVRARSGSLGRCVGSALAVVVVAGLLGACEPPPPPSAQYTAVQCWPGVGREDYSNARYYDFSGTYPAHQTNCAAAGSSGDDGLMIDFPLKANQYNQAFWQIAAPAGASFSAVRVESRAIDANGWTTNVLVNDTTGQSFSLPELAHDGAWHSASRNGSFALIGSIMTCSAQSGCIGAYQPYIFARAFAFTVTDTTPPDISGVGGPLLSGGPKSGTQSATVTASDQGGGISRTWLRVNGTATSNLAHTCDLATAPAGNIVGNTLTPCPSGSDTHTVDTSRAPFHEGKNNVSACAADYSDPAATGHQVNTTCTTTFTVTVS